MTLAITPHLDPDQQAQAACRDQPSDLWFPVRGDNGGKAKAFCRRCPVRVACLTNAVARNEEFGVWGGAGEPARRGLRRAWLAGGDEWAKAVAVHFDALDAGRPLVVAQAQGLKTKTVSGMIRTARDGGHLMIRGRYARKTGTRMIRRHPRATA